MNINESRKRILMGWGDKMKTERERGIIVVLSPKTSLLGSVQPWFFITVGHFFGWRPLPESYCAQTTKQK